MEVDIGVRKNPTFYNTPNLATVFTIGSHRPLIPTRLSTCLVAIWSTKTTYTQQLELLHRDLLVTILHPHQFTVYFFYLAIHVKDGNTPARAPQKWR